MTSDASALEDYGTAPPDMKVEIANGSFLDVEGFGKLELLIM